MDPGEVAATAGTSGVVYGVVDRPVYDPASRVNGFAHVNHTLDNNRIGILLCINGAGIQYSWMNQQVAENGVSYPVMEAEALKTPIGADGLSILPFGNGAERMLGNRAPGAQIANLHFNRHGRGHLYRAALEGVAYSFVYGMEILQQMGVDVGHLRVGNDNMFQSGIFSSAISTLMDARIEVIETTGAVGAAIAAGLAPGIYSDIKEPLGKAECCKMYEPTAEKPAFEEAYASWKEKLNHYL